MFGLMSALEAQGKKGEAAAVRKAFHKAWKYAHIKLNVNEL